MSVKAHLRLTCVSPAAGAVLLFLVDALGFISVSLCEGFLCLLSTFQPPSLLQFPSMSLQWTSGLRLCLLVFGGGFTSVSLSCSLVSCPSFLNWK